MQLIYNKIFLEHDTGSHPENKKRLESLGPIEETDIVFDEEPLHLVHSQSYIDRVKDVCREGGALDPDTLTSKQSYAAAVHAVGAAIAASKNDGFALVRPPGHHAYADKGTGFCLFNNIAIATQRLVKQGKRVMIFDFDGHCGDGTEDFFYATDQVLFWSLHQSPAFPYKGSEDDIGEGKGRGYTINVPLPPESGDDIFFKAVERLMPIAEQFKPDVVGVSAGFDAHQYDPLLNLRLSVSAYYKIGKLLSKKFFHVFATLEGGYNTEILPKCIKNFLCGINNESIFYEEKPTDSMIQVIDELDMRMSCLERHLSEFWKF